MISVLKRNKKIFFSLFGATLLFSSKGVAASLPYSTVHFPFDRTKVVSREHIRMNENAAWLNNNSDSVVVLEGHCDEIGSNDYNMRLGDRRAREVKEQLIKKGVPYDQIIMVISFGESEPIDPAHNKNAWRKNRRVEFELR